MGSQGSLQDGFNTNYEVLCQAGKGFKQILRGFG